MGFSVVFCSWPGPPASWELEWGRWAWLPPGEPWYVVQGVEMFGLTFEIRLPRLVRGSPRSQHHGFGRPRVQDCDPGRLRAAALDIDLIGRSRRSYGDEHYADVLDSRKAAKRDADAARRMLAGEGVLPWAAWANGRLPAEWWRDDRFLNAVDDWASDARLRDLDEFLSTQGRSVWSGFWSQFP